MPEMPTEWLRANTLFPGAGLGLTILVARDDPNPATGQRCAEVHRSGAGTLYARNFSHGNFPNPIIPRAGQLGDLHLPPPIAGDRGRSPLTAEWSPAQAGRLVTVKISNTSNAGDTTELL